MPNGAIRHRTYDAIMVASVTLGRADSTAIRADRRSGDPDAPDDLARVDEHLDRLAELEAAGDLDGYADEVSRMIQFIERGRRASTRSSTRSPKTPR